MREFDYDQLWAQLFLPPPRASFIDAHTIRWQRASIRQANIPGALASSQCFGATATRAPIFIAD
ncbi:MAG: hypothetical protein JO045_09090 [Mycobacterium sp.]|nr:hypothetical protein [Mycobacterium sp.]